MTVGPALSQATPFDGLLECSEACTLTDGFQPTGPSYRSPIDGTIVRWRIYGATGLNAPGINAAYRLRVLTPREGGTTNPVESRIYTGAGSSDTETPQVKGLSTFPASLHIRAGQLIGIDLLNEYSDLGWEENFSMRTLLWAPPIQDEGVGRAEEIEGLVLAFNADIQPPPTLSYLSRSRGSIEGGSSVTLGGSDFAGATTVLFGGAPATFTVKSDTEITATAPPSSTPGKVGITVQTPAGTTPSAKQFAYIACTVPNLKDRRLKSAKGRLRRRYCRPGRVTRLPGATAKTGRVVKQHPKPGSILPPGAAVSITLKKHS